MVRKYGKKLKEKKEKEKQNLNKFHNKLVKADEIMLIQICRSYIRYGRLYMYIHKYVRAIIFNHVQFLWPMTCLIQYFNNNSSISTHKHMRNTTLLCILLQFSCCLFFFFFQNKKFAFTFGFSKRCLFCFSLSLSLSLFRFVYKYPFYVLHKVISV